MMGSSRLLPGFPLRQWALILAAAWALTVSAAAQQMSAAGDLLFHFGDDPRWAAPALDDGGWATVQRGQVPLPLFDSDGVLWVRVRAAIPRNATEPLAIRLQIGGTHPGAVAVFVDGRAAGTEGAFPPQGAPEYLPATAVFDVPTGAAAPGSTVVVAVRAWYMPRSRPMSRSSHATTGFLENTGSIFGTRLELTIGSAETLCAVDRSERLSKLLGSMPDLAVNALLCLTGLALIVFWRWTRRAELAWCSALLISDSLYEYFFVATDRGYLNIHYREWGMLFSLLSIATMMVSVEFVRVVHGLRGGAWRWAAHACWIVAMTGQLAGLLALEASAGLHAALAASVWAVQAFGLIMVCANLWVLLVLRYNRVIAGAMASISLAAGAAHFGFRQHWEVGSADISLFDVATIVSGFAIAAMLLQRAVAAWKQSQQLRVEFEAGREVQERLITASLPEITGFRMESAYHPATEVGGDFYQILPQEDGSSILVIGDVSGKGLKAAMTGTLALGAMRAFASENPGPGTLLARVNRELCSARSDGFITCMVARIAPDGLLTVANAGHLAPYRNGQEMKIEPGLPLGISGDAEYAETTVATALRDTLTFLSDGVVEARDADGELFGFERTRAISTQSAQEIARAAQAFGQEDDITVLRLEYAGAEVARA